jgi:hypothetical protein
MAHNFMTSFPREAQVKHELQQVSEVPKLFRKHWETVLRNALERGRQLYLLIQTNAQIEILSNAVPYISAVHKE